MNENCVIVSGCFDDMRSANVRFLEEAAREGCVHVLLWSDASMNERYAQKPKFPEAERWYFLEALRYVNRVTMCDAPSVPDCLPDICRQSGATWIVEDAADNPAKRAFCRAHGLNYRVINHETLDAIPECSEENRSFSNAKRVIVTGSFDWFHTGHIRFFEEVAELGDLYAVVGHDANIRLLKGDGHPLFPEKQRRYLVHAIRHVKQSLISTGQGWLDAEPEIRRIKPHIYAVNEDGDRPEKRRYCETHGIEYRVLKRIPKQGLPQRQSTVLRGF